MNLKEMELDKEVKQIELDNLRRILDEQTQVECYKLRKRSYWSVYGEKRSKTEIVCSLRLLRP